ncbi:Cellulase (glycosyl hydrolase family 5) protein [Striga hermonthica]|uniref:Cellulase (Glycosyl hydrolase family 5) protein n=1 Tax=Striga hermonthica TaxID=68872 RepID=A0A9N7R429_STRHE|nr:Cellulase (glycosyl hydrolase family 5) protein [Striga hermonthica]
MEKSIWLLWLFVCCVVGTEALQTDSRWIVDDWGKRVKLSCVNWPSHLEAGVAEGLSKRPVDAISKGIAGMGFNCVRFTWPLFLFTNDTLAATTVRRSFTNLGLFESIAGFQTNNPAIIDLSLLDAYQAVVASLAKNNVLIILDNHISILGWCCSSFDENGFFGDKYFDPDQWLKGLTKVATTFNDTKNVVGMSLRNELRGPRQNVNDWYKHMTRGAEAVHAANPNVIIILSGLQFDSDLSFLAAKPVNLSFSNKLAFEMHWYGFSNGQVWKSGNLNQVCGEKMADIKKKVGFLLDEGYPLFMSEFGFDMRGTNVNDNRFLHCLMGWAAEFDIDWALWTLPGSYYIRQGVVGHDETYGVYNWNWCDIRNQTMLNKISALQYTFTGPGYEEAHPHKLLFHPMTGLCVQIKFFYFYPPQMVLGPCPKAQQWKYTPQQTLTVIGTYFCLQAGGLGNLATLGIFCNENDSKWEAISNSKMHLSSKLQDGTTLCLDINSDNNIITNDCKCLATESKCNPASQWFKIIDSTRYKTHGKNYPKLKSIVKNITKKFLGGSMFL